LTASRLNSGVNFRLSLVAIEHLQLPVSHHMKCPGNRGNSSYGQRFATVEPVFANIRYNKRLNRFTLRGQRKVDTQWKLFCLVHNIEKLAHNGYAQ
jgi:hypothetical protein